MTPAPHNVPKVDFQRAGDATHVQVQLLTVDSPVWPHLPSEHGQVVVEQHGCVQSVDTLPWVGRGMRSLTVVLSGHTGEIQTQTTQTDRMM